MEFTIDAVANKMILCIVGLSILVAIGGFVFFGLTQASYESIPFAVGVAMAMGLNILKVYWLKSSINRSVEIETPRSAGLFFQGQYFLRLLLTVGVLLAAAHLPDNIVNLIGAIVGMLTFPIAMRLMQLFVPKDVEIPRVNPLSPSGSVQDSINELEAIGRENEHKEGE